MEQYQNNSSERLHVRSDTFLARLVVQSPTEKLYPKFDLPLEQVELSAMHTCISVFQNITCCDSVMQVSCL